ncbi:cell division protein SepF [Pseudonocardia sp. ICBG1142]|uniref:cell division protein SepF n=1 Tax=Pseudonocardia sp. ICBG1142 TaxID=2846760 RepID=UPI001CF6E77D|nr:cell division protein SepF [Pseudonocardia sp. ICBG1142]
MSAMYRLKAYFGMVPADEMDYVDEPDHYRGGHEHHAGPRGDRWSAGAGRFADQASYDDDRYEPAVRYEDGWGARPARETLRPARAVRQDPRGERETLGLVPERGSLPTPLGGGAGAAVRGALAMDPESLRGPAHEERSEPVVAPAPVPEQRDRAAAGPASITTLHPRSYNEARTIGERYRDGVPVIMNLTDLDGAAAKRLVDFAAGLAFALRGSIDKVTDRVFLLTPADVEVSADDARRLAERGAFRQD